MIRLYVKTILTEDPNDLIRNNNYYEVLKSTLFVFLWLMYFHSYSQ